MNNKMRARQIMLDSIKKLPTDSARRKWVAILATPLVEMQKGSIKK